MRIIRSRHAVNAIAAMLMFMFAYTAVSKFFNFRIFQYTLSEAPLIGNHAGIAAYVLSVLNLLPVTLLLIPALRRAGLVYSFFLLLVYSGYIGYALVTAKHLPCSCSGIAPWLSWKNHLWVNFGFILLAAIGYLLSKRLIAINPPASGQDRQQAMLKTCIKE